MSAINVSSVSGLTSTTGAQLIEWIFYYPPNGTTNVLPSYIQGVSIDPYYNVLITYNAATPLELLIDTITQQTSTVTIAVTPQGYVNWYNNNIGTMTTATNYTQMKLIYNQCTSQFTSVLPPIGQFATLQVFVDAFNKDNGYITVPYSQAASEFIGTGANISSQFFANIISVSGSSQSNLYALVNPHYNPNPLFNIPSEVWVILIGGGLILLVAVVLQLLGPAATTVKTVSSIGEGKRERKQRAKSAAEDRKAREEEAKRDRKARKEEAKRDRESQEKIAKERSSKEYKAAAAERMRAKTEQERFARQRERDMAGDTSGMRNAT